MMWVIKDRNIFGSEERIDPENIQAWLDRFVASYFQRKFSKLIW